MRTDKGTQPDDGQGRGKISLRVSVRLPLFEKELPPSRKTSRLGAGLWAKTQGKTKRRIRIKDGMVRTLRISLPSTTTAGNLLLSFRKVHGLSRFSELRRYCG